MGKTFGNKGDIIKYDEKYLDSNGYSYKAGHHICEGLVRHPNKKKKRSITREFIGSAANPMGRCRNRFGGRDYQSSRMRACRRLGTRERRAYQREETKSAIKESLNEEV